MEFDPYRESEKNLMVLCFQKSSSSSFPVALDLAIQADNYLEKSVSGTVIYYAAFGKSKTQAVKCMELLKYISGWKSTLVFTMGMTVQYPQLATDVLHCYVSAMSCDDWKAHCMSIKHDTISRAASVYEFKYIFPCSLIDRQYKHEPDHPASPQDRIQALATHCGCSWCPLFDKENYASLSGKEQHGADIIQLREN